MRNFGNAHYGEIDDSLRNFTMWKNNNARYYDQFLPKLQAMFDRKRYGNKADVIGTYISLLRNTGGNESASLNASKSKGGYKAPSSFAYKTEFLKHRDAGKGTSAALSTNVDYFFAEGTGAVHDEDPDVFVESGLSMQEMAQMNMSGSSGRGQGYSKYRDRMAERQAERQARVASGETFVPSRGQQAASLDIPEEESFFARYQTPIVIGSALALAGGAYYFFVVRK